MYFYNNLIFKMIVYDELRKSKKGYNVCHKKLEKQITKKSLTHIHRANTVVPKNQIVE
jgi:hypothetical protein